MAVLDGALAAVGVVALGGVGVASLGVGVAVGGGISVAAGKGVAVFVAVAAIAVNVGAAAVQAGEGVKGGLVVGVRDVATVGVTGVVAIGPGEGVQVAGPTAKTVGNSVAVAVPVVERPVGVVLDVGELVRGRTVWVTARPPCT